MMTVREAVDVTRPSQLRHVWHSLWSRTPRASFRQTPEFLEAALATMNVAHGRHTSESPPDRWRFLIVSAWDRPIGIISLRERVIQRTLGTSRILAMPQSPWGCLPGPVSPHPATTLAAVVRHLVEKDDSWDILELPEVVADGVEPNRVPQVFASSRRAVFQRPSHELLGLELPATFGQFWADRDSAARQSWRELEARRTLRSDEKFIRFRPDGAVSGDTLRNWNFLNQLEGIVRLQAGSPHGAQSQKLFECLCELHPVTVDSGCADISVLLSDTRLVAFAYNFHCRSRVETALLLADPHAPQARERLIGLMLRDEIARGDTWHVFLPNSVQGAELNRRLWEPIELHETTVAHDRRTSIRSRVLRWLDGDRQITSASCC